MFKLDFNGKKVVITGASSGLGRSTAIALSALGAECALLARSQERLEETARLMQADKQPIILKCDLSDVESLKQGCVHLNGQWGQIDILIHNAGMWAYGPLEEIDEETILKMVNLSVTASLLLTKDLLPGLLKGNDPQVLNVVSTAGLHSHEVSPHSGAAAYHAAKWGQAGFGSAMRAELKQKGIKVTNIYPGAFEVSPQEGIMSHQDVVEAILFALSRPKSSVVESLTINSL